MSYNPYQQTPGVPSLSGKSHVEHAKAKIRTPAILLMVGGIVNALFGIVIGSMMPLMFFGMRDELQQEMAKDPEMTPELTEFVINLYGYGGVALAIVSLICGVIVVIGATGMLGLRSWGFGLFAAILSMIPCFQSCWLLTVPIGIYVIVALSDPQVKSAFDQKA